MDLDVLAFDLLDPFSLILLIFPILVKLGERVPDIVDKKLWKLLVIFDDVAEEFTKAVVND